VSCFLGVVHLELIERLVPPEKQDLKVWPILILQMRIETLNWALEEWKRPGL